MSLSLFAAVLLQTATPVVPCAAEAPLPAGLEGWATIRAISMGPVRIGETTGLMLQPSAKVVFVLKPERAPADGTFSSVYSVNVTRAGTYRIALSAGAWIDVVRDGKAIASVAHTEGAVCSSIRKIVDFTLAPGTYRLQLSGAKSAEMRVLIVPK
jgi:hypothetical protein